MKKDATEHMDRYYDEKKKWQALLRTAESEISSLLKRGKLTGKERES